MEVQVLRRGQAELIGGLIVLTMVLVILVPFLLQVLLDYRRVAEEQERSSLAHLERLAEKIQVSWLSPLDGRYPAFWVNNTGTVRVTLKTVYIVDLTANRLLYIVNLTDYQPEEGKPIRSITKYPQAVRVSRAPITLNPGEAALVEVDPGMMVKHRRIAVSLLSDRGVIHPVQGRGASIEDVVLKAVSVEQRVIFIGDILNSPGVELKDPNALSNVNPTTGVRGYTTGGATYGYSIQSTCNNCPLDSVIRFRNAIIGFEPGSSSRLNILLTYVEGSTLYRVKVLGFQPEEGFYFRYRTSDGLYNIYVDNGNYSGALGFWYYGTYSRKGVIEASIAEVRLKGLATSFTVYRQDFSRSMSSYDPYIIVADTDGNGVGELIFTTEDYYYGSSNPPQVICDVDEGSNFLDYSVVKVDDRVEPDTEWGFAFMIKDVSIDPRLFAGVMVVLRVYFHDTEMGSFTCVDQGQLPILRVLLVRSDWSIVDSRTFLYWELASVENTWPPSTAMTTLTVSLFIPNDIGERVYLAIAVLDPFRGGPGTGQERGRNDLDLTLPIEIIGISTFAR
jgi:hypothetical protein